MEVPEIKHVDGLIKLENGKRIVEHRVKRLTGPGENFCSLILSVDIVVETPNATEEIHCVAKLIPPNQFIQDLFEIPVAFRNEIGFYKHIVPLLQDFQREHGVEPVIDCFPKLYGGRLNLDCDNSRVDGDAVLLLENLKSLNFNNPDRIAGLDFEAAKLVITDLAHLQATALALKLQKPEVFAREVQPYLKSRCAKESVMTDLRSLLDQLLGKIEGLEPVLERIKRAFEKLSVTSEAREPFATICHNDCWTNNNMMKVGDNKPIKNKLVDFQVCDYGSPGKDVVFFLFSSLKVEVLKKHYEELVKLYHDIFIVTLQKLDCDTEQFSF